MNTNKSIINFFFEVGMLANSPRTGFHFLGTGRQSVAEHINRVIYIAYALARMEEGVDVGKIVMMCLFHDLAEARTGDLNYIHQKYVESDEHKVIYELTDTLPFGKEMVEILMEFRERKSRESLLAKDADQLEWLLSLKEQADRGNTRALKWISTNKKRLKTERAKELAEVMLSVDSSEWWEVNTDADWWINRNEKVIKKRF